MVLKIVIGLPFSGKTTYVNNYKDLNSEKNIKIFDDIKDFNIILGYLHKNKNTLDEVFIIDALLCIDNNRHLYKLKEIFDKIEYIFFENNPDKCIENAKKTTDNSLNINGIINEIKYLSYNYALNYDLNNIKNFIKVY